MQEKDNMDTFTIPDRYRKVGNPGGAYIIYMEDYVHTFIKQSLLIAQQEVILSVYGRLYQFEGRNYIMIHAATECDTENIENFPNETYLGRVKVKGKGKEKKDNFWRITCELLGNISCVVEDYYIYYEKNEIMQNYLIEWHNKQEQGENRKDNELTMKYTRALQDKIHMAAEENLQQRIFTAFCLAFLIIFAAMFVTVLNNYQKMLQLQDSVAYLMDNIDEFREIDAIQTMEQYVSDGPTVLEKKMTQENIVPSETQEEDMTITETEEEDTEQETTDDDTMQAMSEVMTTDDSSAIMVGQAATEPENISQERDEPEKEQDIDQPTNNTITYQVYTVQKGDTLQDILYRQYGNLAQITTICTLNQLDNPDDIKEGEILYLP